MRTCIYCKKTKPTDEFSPAQQAGSWTGCVACLEPLPNPNPYYIEMATIKTLVCMACKNCLPPSNFSNNQRIKKTRRCIGCVTTGYRPNTPRKLFSNAEKDCCLGCMRVRNGGRAILEHDKGVSRGSGGEKRKKKSDGSGYPEQNGYPQKKSK
jgi:hypothetical protein